MKAETGNRARESPLSGSTTIGMCAPRPSIMARCLCERAGKQSELVVRFSAKDVHGRRTTRAVKRGDDDDAIRLDNSADGGHAGSMTSSRSRKGS